ncbi:MAG: lipid-A-disaccharide synthase [Candidatus Sumerlaeota bacterium]|nr:lipid-A-disaccharide synthase [Candidatus Sumerlaeota bacterium]
MTPTPENERPIKLFVIAGENSGDVHGSNLFKALFRKDPTIRAYGLGGPLLDEVGVKLKANIVEDLAIIGFVGVVTNFPEIRRLFYNTVHFLDKFRPDALVLVDYPGFNIRIAEKAKNLGIPVIWYISPQIWAWHRSRLYKLARIVDRMIVIFPFEVGLYREEGVDVVHVGHPLFDVIKVDLTREQVCAEFGLDASRPLIGLIPGSRRKEVRQFLPIMLEGVKRYHEIDPQAQFVIVQATTISDDTIESAIARAELDFKPLVVNRLRYSVRNSCDFSWVKSGTSTLEAAILGTPMLIVYRVNSLTWLIGKQVFTIGHIGLPNIVAGDRIVPELLQDEFTPRNLAEKTHHYLSNPDEYARMVSDLQDVKEKLGGDGASDRAADAVLELVRERRGNEVQETGSDWEEDFDKLGRTEK